MQEVIEEYIYGSKNNELFTQSWNKDNEKGRVLLTHGMGEHSDCYNEVVSKLNGIGWSVSAWDLPGHGKSEGKRGYIDEFDTFEKDLVKVIKHFSAPKKPIVLLAHSLGGLIVLKTLLTHKVKNVSAVNLSSPLTGLSLEAPQWKVKFAEMAAKWMPKVTLWNEVKYRDLTRDENFLPTYASDPLRHDKISPNFFLGIMRSLESIHENAENFSLPLQMQLAGDDKIVDSNKSIDFFERARSSTKELKVYNESFHEIYNDLDKEYPLKDLASFVSRFERKK